MSLLRSRFAPASRPGRSRRRQPRAIAALIAAGLGCAVSAASSRAVPSDFAVSDAWIRLTIPGRPAAGYFTLTNNTGVEAALVGALSPGCGSMMLHQTVDSGGVESMRMVDEVRVPAHGSARFAPGGYHLMCMAPTALIAKGQRVPVTLRLADGRALTVDFAIRGAPER